MNHSLLKALYIILISLGLAVTFNFLFFDKLIGISVLIFTVVLLGAVFLFGLRQQLHFQKIWWLGLPILFFALMPSIRSNEFLSFLNLCATLGLLMLLAHELTGTPTFLMKLLDYLSLAVLVPLRMLSRALYSVSLIGQIHSEVKHRDVWIRVIKGVLMAIPLLIIFGVLFSQADLAFSRFINSFVTITISEHSIQYLVLLLFAFVAALSWLSYIFFPKKIPQTKTDEKSKAVTPGGRNTEVLVFLGLISTLFLVFIAFQITYLFGGETNIAKAGFTYAEYARRGFWELLAVAMLSLVVLFVSEKYAGVESKRNKQFLIPALVLIAEVIIVIASAFKRLSLYIDAYSLTALRFYAAGFIMLLLALFILLTVKFMKAKQEQFFTFGTLLLVITFLVAVNIVNPDAFIAKSNMEQYNRTGKIDVLHVGELSADAEPWKIELYQKLEGEDKEVLREFLQKDKDHLQKSSDNWQSANLSRTRALKIIQEVE
ncbi:MAG: DUF4173 domain-containing protein [Candidatus Andersenbacteria bacterium]